jgi:hypothetical protein
MPPKENGENSRVGAWNDLGERISNAHPLIRGNADSPMTLASNGTSAS